MAGDVAGGVEQVFPGNRHAVERAQSETRARPFRRGGGLGPGALRRGAEINVVRGVDALDALEKMLGKCHRVDLAPPNAFAESQSAHLMQMRRHVAYGYHMLDLIH